MIGAIIGDTVGSVYEFDNIKTKDFEFLTPKCFPTDDSMMTLAVAGAILDSGCNFAGFEDNLIDRMKEIGRENPGAGYGGRFRIWLRSDDRKPYNSWGNGSAMRVSPCGFAAKSLEEAEKLAERSAAVTHNHPEGIKGAKAVAAAIYLAKTGSSKEEIKKYIEDNYYKLDFTLDEIRPTYPFDESCMGTVPQALECFFESTDFEDSIRNAISLGGDCDTTAAMVGGISEAFYGVPEAYCKRIRSYLAHKYLEIIDNFESKYQK